MPAYRVQVKNALALVPGSGTTTSRGHKPRSVINQRASAFRGSLSDQICQKSHLTTAGSEFCHCVSPQTTGHPGERIYDNLDMTYITIIYVERAARPRCLP
jgi:hypothetical protein